MAVTLPSFTKSMDDFFVTTWYEVREQAIDNIMDATPVWASLRESSFTSQVGGQDITRTLKYSNADLDGLTADIDKGVTLPSGVPELETTARWDWRYFAVPVQRNLIDDSKNNGQFRIKGLVEQRLEDARDSLVQKLEGDILRAARTAETGNGIQSLNDIIPDIADVAAGTYGGITRPASYGAAPGLQEPATGNTFWGAKYRQLQTPNEVHLLSDMKSFYNDIHNNQEAPNLLICDRGLYDIYEEFAMDQSQIIKDESTRLADLGFEVLRFKGKPMMYSPNVASGDIMFLNTQHIEIVHNPSLWFEMTMWKSEPLQLDRILHILSMANVVSGQLRKHGRLYT